MHYYIIGLRRTGHYTGMTKTQQSASADQAAKDAMVGMDPKDWQVVQIAMVVWWPEKGVE